MRLCSLLLGIAASYLARYGQLSLVAIVAAASSAMMAWREFSDADAKVERYSGSITELEQLLSWWDCLTDVRKASRESITELVRSAETIISQEQLSWTSAGSKQSAVERKTEGNEKDDEAG